MGKRKRRGKARKLVEASVWCQDSGFASRLSGIPGWVPGLEEGQGCCHGDSQVFSSSPGWVGGVNSQSSLDLAVRICGWAPVLGHTWGYRLPVLIMRGQSSEQLTLECVCSLWTSSWSCRRVSLQMSKSGPSPFPSGGKSQDIFLALFFLK